MRLGEGLFMDTWVAQKGKCINAFGVIKRGIVSVKRVD